MTKFFFLSWVIMLALPGQPLLAQTQTIDLKQSKQALLADQRLVGNVRAQAKREGVIVDVPQLFVYFGDFSPAFHLAGERATLIRDLELVINTQRRERSMVGLDRLLERAVDDTGQPIRPDQLPSSDLLIVFYDRAECTACQRVKQTVSGWLEDQDQTSTWINISLD